MKRLICLLALLVTTSSANAQVQGLAGKSWMLAEHLGSAMACPPGQEEWYAWPTCDDEVYWLTWQDRFDALYGATDPDCNECGGNGYSGLPWVEVCIGSNCGVPTSCTYINPYSTWSRPTVCGDSYGGPLEDCETTMSLSPCKDGNCPSCECEDPCIS